MNNIVARWKEHRALVKNATGTSDFHELNELHTTLVFRGLLADRQQFKVSNGDSLALRLGEEATQAYNACAKRPETRLPALIKPTTPTDPRITREGGLNKLAQATTYQDEHIQAWQTLGDAISKKLPNEDSQTITRTEFCDLIQPKDYAGFQKQGFIFDRHNYELSSFSYSKTIDHVTRYVFCNPKTQKQEESITVQQAKARLAELTDPETHRQKHESIREEAQERYTAAKANLGTKDLTPYIKEMLKFEGRYDFSQALSTDDIAGLQYAYTQNEPKISDHKTIPSDAELLELGRKIAVLTKADGLNLLTGTEAAISAIIRDIQHTHPKTPITTADFLLSFLPNSSELARLATEAALTTQPQTYLLSLFKELRLLVPPNEKFEAVKIKGSQASEVLSRYVSLEQNTEEYKKLLTWCLTQTELVYDNTANSASELDNESPAKRLAYIHETDREYQLLQIYNRDSADQLKPSTN